MSDVQITLGGQSDAQITATVPGIQGPVGVGFPTGGTANQVLFKQSSTNYDAAWGAITSAMIGDLQIVDADVSASAAIAGTKISPNFGSQNVTTTGTSTAASFIPTSSTAPTNGLYLSAANSVALSTNGTGRLFVNSDGSIQFGNPSATRLQVAATSAIGDSLYSYSSNYYIWGFRNESNSLTIESAFGGNIIFKAKQDGVASSPGAATERLRITSTGQLSHIGAGSSGSPAVSFSGSAASNSLVVDSSSRVGVGTASPTNPLHVSNTAGTSAIFERTGSNGVFVGLKDGSGNVAYLGNTNGAFSIQTAGSGYSDKLVVTSAGLVGIGTSAPQTNLDCRGSILTTNGTTRWGLIGTDADGAYLGTAGINHPWIFKVGNGSADVERMRLTSTGLGIGTTSPTYRVHASGTTSIIKGDSAGASSTAPSLDLYDSTHLVDVILTPASGTGIVGTYSTHPFTFYTNNQPRATIDTSGRLLVGTSSATSYGSFSPHSIESTTFENYTLSIKSNSATANTLNSANLILSRSGGNAVGSMTTVASGSRLGSLFFAGADGTNLEFAAAIEAFVDGTPGADDMPGRLVFSTTADGAASPTERMRIDSSGRVGIGTTSPSALLTAGAAYGGTPNIQTVAVIQSATNTYVTVGAGSSSQGGILFADTAANNAGGMLYSHSTDSLEFLAGGNEAARIDSSRRLLVGTSSFSDNATQVLQGQSGGSTAHAILWINRGSSAASGNAIGVIRFADSSAGQYAQILCEADAATGSGDYPGRLVFSTTADGAASPTERMRINAAGGFKFSDTGTYTSATDAKAEFRQSTNVEGLSVRSTNASLTTSVLLVRADRDASAGEYNLITAGVTAVANRFLVLNSGNVQNTNNSYGAISDIKLKENIVDANSQWDDIKALQVRNYNLKEGQTHTQIGLVAQEVELVSPGLVTETPDRDVEGNDLGTVTKSVNYSVLYMKAVKALQEAMERIETLEAKVAALENA